MLAREAKPGLMSRPDLDGVLITHRLGERAARSSSQAAEVEAIIAVFDQLATTPGDALGEICRRAIALTSAGSAGISMADGKPGRPMLRWKASAGVVGRDTPYVLPHDGSPCGVALDHRVPQLMTRPDRVFQDIAAAPFPIEETLVVPFFQNGHPAGTLWAICHDRRKQFDAEDVRQLTLLADLIPVALATAAEPRADARPAEAWIDAMPQIVWTARPDGSLVYLNRAWYVYTGQRIVDGTKQWENALAVDDVPMVRSAWAAAVESGRPFEIACRLRRAADDTLRWHLLSARPSHNDHGRPRYWLGTCSDFHDRAQT